MDCVPSGEVAGHAEVGGRVDAVGGEVDFEDVVVFDAVVFGGGASDESVGLVAEDDNAVVRSADADFVFGAYHAEGFDAADFRFFDFEFVSVGVVEGCAYGGYDDGLPGVDVGSAAYNLHGAVGEAEVYGGDMEVVAVGVLDAGEHFADDYSAEASADCLDALDAAGLEAGGCQRRRNFFGGHAEFGREELLKPFIRNVHCNEMYKLRALFRGSGRSAPNKVQN